MLIPNSFKSGRVTPFVMGHSSQMVQGVYGMTPMELKAAFTTKVVLHCNSWIPQLLRYLVSVQQLDTHLIQMMLLRFLLPASSLLGRLDLRNPIATIGWPRVAVHVGSNIFS